jgi:hypothetical protein
MECTSDNGNTIINVLGHRSQHVSVPNEIDLNKRAPARLPSAMLRFIQRPGYQWFTKPIPMLLGHYIPSKSIVRLLFVQFRDRLVDQSNDTIQKFLDLTWHHFFLQGTLIDKGSTNYSL